MKPTFATPDEVSLQQFRALAAIAQTGSFTLAADALQLTQPAVSHLIKRMEQQLGQPLVVRGRRIRLTDAGQMMADTAQRVVHDASAIDTPILMLVADQDYVVKQAPQKLFFEQS